MRVLFVTPECYPLVKTGGLADVAGALPLALQAQGCGVRVLLPAYPGVVSALAEAEVVARLDGLPGGAARLIAGSANGGIRVLALDAPALYDRPGNPYLGPDGRDWPDNALRFASLAAAGARLAHEGFDLVHAHDWQAGLVAAYLRLGGAAPPVVQTVHNLAFQGLFPAGLLEALQLPPAAFTPDGVEFHGRIGFLKAGLTFADHITTVSPTYAREIRTPEDGMGLDGLLRHRARDLTGIVNGIDTGVWDPAADSHLAAPYDPARPEGKLENRRALERRMGLAAGEGILLGVVSRLTAQKGLDLLPPLLPGLVAAGCRLALLGTGEAALEAAYREAAARHPGRVGVVIGYDEGLAHLIQAGADAILVPSRFEPCGLTQLIGLRYGTLPVVARTGGLADTVIDANEAARADGVATGFQFAPVTTTALAQALERVQEAFADPPLWRRLVHRAMTREVGWQAPAAAYLDLYRKLVAAGPQARQP